MVVTLAAAGTGELATNPPSSRDGRGVAGGARGGAAGMPVRWPALAEEHGRTVGAGVHTPPAWKAEEEVLRCVLLATKSRVPVYSLRLFAPVYSLKGVNAYF